MNYHNITTDDMLNGSGLRVVLWCSGCTCHCANCQNPQTWDFNSGIPFDEDAMNEICNELNKPYISGLTLSGGHPLEHRNLKAINDIVAYIKERYPNKSIWIYTGLDFEDILKDEPITNVVKHCDVLVDGQYIEELKDVNMPWCGSSNQRVIDIQKSFEQNKVVFWHE